MITGITLGGYSLIQEKWLLQSLKNPSFPATVYTRSKRSGTAGSKLVTPELSSFQLILDVIIVGDDFADLGVQRDNFLGIIGNVHRLGTQTLVITRSDGSSRQIDIAAVAVTGDITVDQMNSSLIEITLEAEYPLMQGISEYNEDVLLSNGGGIAIPMGVPLNFSEGSSTVQTITNNGNYPAYPTFTFVGLLTDPTITNLETGQSFSLSLTLADSSHSVVVDTYLGLVTQYPSGNPGRQYASGPFWTVPVGTSKVQLTTSGGSDTGKCTISFRDSFLNI